MSDVSAEEKATQQSDVDVSGSTDITASDPRIVQMLSTEHWSVLSARSLAYNETFTRAGMFLSFLSMSIVALGLLAQGSGFDRDFLVISTIVLSFDLVIGLSTHLRLAGAGYDDLVALHGMTRIRHAYTQIAPAVRPYFTAPVHDDVDSVLASYPSAWGETVLGQLCYVLSTTLGMIALIVSALAGVLAAVVAALVGFGMPLLVGVAGTVLAFVLLAVTTWRLALTLQADLPAMFPADGGSA